MSIDEGGEVLDERVCSRCEGKGEGGVECVIRESVCVIHPFVLMVIFVALPSAMLLAFFPHCLAAFFLG